MKILFALIKKKMKIKMKKRTQNIQKRRKETIPQKSFRSGNNGNRNFLCKRDGKKEEKPEKFEKVLDKVEKESCLMNNHRR